MAVNGDRYSFAQAIDLVLSADTPFEVFGTLGGDANTARKNLFRQFRRLARTLAPDAFANIEHREFAENAFARLVNFYAEAQDLIREGTYLPETKQPTNVVELRPLDSNSPSGSHVIDSVEPSPGDITDLCRYRFLLRESGIDISLCIPPHEQYSRKM